MKVLVVGGGGREHAIVHKLSKSRRVSELYCAPGNGGIARLAACLPYKAPDIDGILSFVKHNAVDLVFVAPDDPLAAGMVDILEQNGIRTFGPRKDAARIEYSKAFSKSFMQKYNIPTASYGIFDSPDKASSYARTLGYPVVIKADGLALGKGVIIAKDRNEADAAINSMLCGGAFGEAGRTIIVEEFLNGPEVTVLAFVDGNTVVPMADSRDHKKAFDNDKGLNTGGMGAISPSRLYDASLADRCMREIFLPTVNAFKSEGIVFKGVLYFGLLLTADGPKVLEYNARFGDPEAQVVLSRLKTDLMDVIDAVIDQKLHSLKLEWDIQAAACVVLASGGYPEAYRKGLLIKGIEDAEKDTKVTVYHAGTKLDDGRYYTDGGRVLGVTALDETLDKAVDRAYRAAGCIGFEGMHMRKDIGRTAASQGAAAASCGSSGGR